MGSHLWILVAAAIAFLLSLCYTLGPVVVYFVQRERPEDLETLDPEAAGLPDSMKNFLRATVASVTPMGFQVAGYAQKKGRLHLYLAWLVHPTSGDQAMAACIVVAEDLVAYVEFATDFEDGMGIATNNSRVMAGTLAPNPRNRVLQFPHIGNPARLYALHKAALTHFAAGRSVRMPAPADARQKVIADLHRDYAYQITQGYMRRVGPPDAYAPTVKGAILMTWKNCFPVKQILYARKRREMRTLYDILIRIGRV